jgi:hypothetical protein
MPTAVEMWGATYRNGDTYLLDFIKLVVCKIDKTSTTENENSIIKISPKQYKQETEPYWKVLKWQKKYLENLRIQLPNAKALKTTISAKLNHGSCLYLSF